MKTGQRLHFKQVHYVSSRQIAEVLRTADRHTIIVEVVDFFSCPLHQDILSLDNDTTQCLKTHWSDSQSPRIALIMTINTHTQTHTQTQSPISIRLNSIVEKKCWEERWATHRTRHVIVGHAALLSPSVNLGTCPVLVMIFGSRASFLNRMFHSRYTALKSLRLKSQPRTWPAVRIIFTTL